jgi:hypothetical protein
MSTVLRHSLQRPGRGSAKRSTPGRDVFGKIAITDITRKEVLGWVVAYYNGTNAERHHRSFVGNEIVLWRQVEKRRAMISVGVDYRDFCGMERLAVLICDDLRRSPVLAPIKPMEIRTVVQQLQKEHAEFCEAVQWLCSPKRSPLDDPEVRKTYSAKKLDKLYEKFGQVFPFVEQGSMRFLKYFQQHGLDHVKPQLYVPEGKLLRYPTWLHAVDVFCAVLLDECQGKSNPSEMPIKICRGCQKLFVSYRKDAEFCPGGNCQRDAWWPDEKHRDYEWVRRQCDFARNCSGKQHGYKLAHLRQKLAKPKVQKRMQELRARWSKWPKILEMIDEIEAKARGNDEAGTEESERSLRASARQR